MASHASFTTSLQSANESLIPKPGGVSIWAVSSIELSCVGRRNKLLFERCGSSPGESKPEILVLFPNGVPTSVLLDMSQIFPKPNLPKLDSFNPIDASLSIEALKLPGSRIGSGTVRSS